MSNLTFLTEEQCLGKNKIDIIKKRGAKATITDFAILLGGHVSNYHIDNDDSLDGRTAYYWTKSDDSANDVRIVDVRGNRDWLSVNTRDGGARPAFSFSSISSIPTNGVSKKRAEDGIYEVEYGYYPQKAVSKDMQIKLEQAFKNGRLLKTGKGYTTDSRRYDDYDEKFKPKRHEEYQYNGKRYVRVEANSDFDGVEFQLSNGEYYKDEDYVWVEVQPIKWLGDLKAKIMITEKLIFAGVPFSHAINYHTEDFYKTDIKIFMDKYFSKEIEQSRKQTDLEKIDKAQTRQTRLQKLNPDDTVPSTRAKMTDTEIIHNWIESGESVLLR